MNRPSHWMLASICAAAVALVATGNLQAWITNGPAVQSQAAADAGDDAGTSVVVQRRSTPPAVAAAQHVLSGTVVDRFGWPVERARVFGRGDDYVETDAQGRFELAWEGPLLGTLLVEAPGRHAPAEVMPSLDEMQIVLQDALPWEEQGPRPELAGDAPLLVGEGYLRSKDGSQLAGGRVRVPENGALAVSDDTGRFVLPLRPGPFSLVAWDTGLIATVPSMKPSREQGKIPLPDLVLMPGLQISGVVVDSNDEPVAGARVQIENAGSDRVVRTDSAGRFAVDGLAPVETAITVVPTRGMLGLRRTAPLADNTDLGYLTMERPRQEPLRLRVVDDELVPQPWVHVVADQEDGLSRAYAQADDSGQVSIGGVGSGPVAFEVRNPDFDPMQIADFDPASRTLVVSR